MTQLLQNAAYGAALILTVAVLRRVLKDRLVPEARLALWAVCLFRLLTPAAPESVFSLWGLPKLFAPEKQAAPSLNAAGYIPAAGTPVPAPTPQADPGISWETALLILWLAASVVLTARYVLIWTRTRRAVACAIPLDQSDMRYSSLPKCARLREGPMAGAPLTFGTMRPTVVLSPGLDGTELDCVLAHEGVHARRRDNLWHYAMALAMVLHWWNPAVWLMSHLLRRDIELSCDRAAVRRLGADRRADYARALVSLSTQAEGPAFCQTFGRKAAEERILSVMKFKRTSIIGVIFSLTLVLAVTAAFASEPKTDDGTQDAYSSVKTGSSQTVMVPLPDKTKEIQSDFPEIDPDDVDLSEMKKILDKKVADGQLTQAEADQRLADTEAVLEQARRGELKLFWYDNGDGENWFYGVGVFQVNSEIQSRFVDPGQMLQPLYYEDENGKLVHVNPDTVANGYVLVSDAAYVVEEGEDISNMIGSLLGEADIKYDEGKTFTNFDVKLPTFDEDGNPVSADGGIIGSRFYDYKFVTDSDAVYGGPLMELDDYKTLLEQLVKDGKMIQADADTIYASARQLLEQRGEMADLYVCDDGSFVVASWRYPCTRADCVNEFFHYHDGVLYAGKAVQDSAASPEPVPSTAPGGVTAQPLVNTAPSASCGVEGCTETRNHAHANGCVILMSEPCPVEGCTTTGYHIHGDVCYSCSGAGHDGGVCDGSCYEYHSPVDVIPTSTHHSGGHHSGGHH